jgi:hypothetical protein
MRYSRVGRDLPRLDANGSLPFIEREAVSQLDLPAELTINWDFYLVFWLFK